jgi:hypothetical protein
MSAVCTSLIVSTTWYSTEQKNVYVIRSKYQELLFIPRLIEHISKGEL